MLLRIAMAVLLAVNGGCWRDMQQIDTESKEKSIEDYDCSDGPCDIEPNEIAVQSKGNWLSSMLYEDKRNSNKERKSPWSCQPDAWLLELEMEFFFPKRIKKYVCGPKSCSPHYRCEQKFYHLQVLKKKGAISKHKLQILDVEYKPPNNLRGTWEIETLKVPVGCECELKIYNKLQ